MRRHAPGPRTARHEPIDAVPPGSGTRTSGDMHAAAGLPPPSASGPLCFLSDGAVHLHTHMDRNGLGSVRKASTAHFFSWEGPVARSLQENFFYF
jgi:hypothetical protein